MNKSNVWIETVTIPTYPVDTPQKAPVFLEKRVYQGSSGRVYPYPVTEAISDEKPTGSTRRYFWKTSI